MKEREFYKNTPLNKINKKNATEYVSIQIPITEEDIRMFQEFLVLLVILVLVLF